jgi:propanediol dehydratase large subunit
MKIHNTLAKSFSTSIYAYALTLGVMVGFPTAEATEALMPSSLCHAATDDVGTNLQNSGVLTNSGSSRAIYCPLLENATQGKTNVGTITVYGNESTDGSSSKTCVCSVGPISCSCDTATAWVNNTGGVSGKVASGVSHGLWIVQPQTTFGYFLHQVTQNSSLAGVYVTFN